MNEKDIYCPNCGIRAKKSDSSLAEGSVSDPIDLQGISLMEISKAENLEETEPEKALSKSDDVSESRNEVIKKIREFALQHKRISIPIAGLFLLFVLYGGIQLIVEESNGPMPQAEKYVAAILDGDFNVLRDKSLFPGNAQIAPLEIQSGREPLSKESTYVVSTKRSGDRATADLVIGSRDIQIDLIASHKNVFGFSVPIWRVFSTAPTLQITGSPQLSPMQKVSIGSATYLNKELPTEVFAVLPSFYKISTSAVGFIDGASNSYGAFEGPNEVHLTLGEMIQSKELVYKATSSMKSKAKSCLQSGCKKLGKFIDTDFDVWTQFIATGYTYTSSKFTKKFKYSSCGQPSFTLVSYNRISASMSCVGKVKAHLYVRNTYFRGYYSDYWLYWNFYDTKDTSVVVSSTITYGNNGKISVTSVKLN